MSLYDEIGMFWAIIIFIICVSFYTVGYLCYRLGYKDGETDMQAKLTRHAEKKIRRGEIKRIR